MNPSYTDSVSACSVTQKFFNNTRARLVALFVLVVVAAAITGTTVLAARDTQEVKARQPGVASATGSAGTAAQQTPASQNAPEPAASSSRVLTHQELAKLGVPDLPQCSAMVTLDMIARVDAATEDPHETFEQWRRAHRSMMEEPPTIECQSKLYRARHQISEPEDQSALSYAPATDATSFVQERVSPEGALSTLAATLGANVDPASGVQDYQGEMQISVNPNNPQQLVAGANSFYRDPSANCISPTGGSGATFGTQALYGSADGGATWTYRCAPWPATLTGGVTGAAAWFGSDPAMTWDAQGNAYAVYMLISQNSSGSSSGASIVVARSTDVGQNWTYLGTVVNNIASTTNFDDKEMTTIDNSPGPASAKSHPGRIYVIWDENNVERVAYSDNGSAWTTVILPAAGFGDFDIGGNVVVGRDGTVYVIWNRGIGPSTQTGEKTVFSKSIDGGATWSTPVVVATQSLLSFGGNNKPPAQETRGLNCFGSLGMDTNPASAYFGRLYVAYPDFPAGVTSGTNINTYLVTSTNSGTSWSAPVKVNDDSGAATQFFPWVSVDQSDGSVNVSWYDTRVDPTNNRRSQLFYARSSNGGVSFEPNIIVDDSGGTVWRNLINYSDENTTDNSARNSNQYGDYSGIIAANRQIHPFWMDSRQFFPSADTTSPSRKEDAAASLITTCTVPGLVAAPTVSSTCGEPGTLVSWSAPASWGTNATSGTYSVYRSTTNAFPGGAPLASGLTTTNYIDTTGAVGTTYYYFVRATNNCPGTSLTPMTSDSAASASIIFHATSGACGALRGNVSSAGLPIGGAIVNDGATSVSTDQNGFYQFIGIAPGTYSVSAAATGYDTGTVNGVVVNNGGNTTQNFNLSPTSASNCLTDTTQTDFGAGVDTTLDLTSSPGDVLLSKPMSVDQQNTTLGNSGVGITTTTWGGQTFTPAVTGQLTSADINLFCSGCTGTKPNLTLSVRATSGGLPTGADLASATITGFSSGSAAFYTATFASPPTLTAGTQYALVIRPTVNPSPGTYALTRSGTSTAGSDVYAGGTRVAGATSGTVWSIPLTGGVSTDAGFRTYMQTGFQTSGNLAPLAKNSNPPAGATTNWTTLSWTATTPANTSVKFQVAASNSVGGPFNFVGPDNTAATFFTTSGASLSQFNGNRYLQYKAYLASSDNVSTPTLSDVTVCYTPAALPAPPTISGQITNASGDQMGGVTVTLSGSQAGTIATDDNGNYTFAVVSGGSVTVTPNLSGYTFAPSNATFNNITTNQSANFVGTATSPPPALGAHDLLISEFRLRGAQGALDEFIKLTNNTTSPITVGTADGSLGWALVALNADGISASTVVTVPNGVTIPGRGHYLIINNTPTTGYGLTGVAGDATFTADIADDTGLALFNTNNLANFKTLNRLDAVGFQQAGSFADLYRENTGMAPIGANDGQYSFVRKLVSGTPQDTDNNAADFIFISTNGGVYGGVNSTLGAPGPENLTTPIVHSLQLKSTLIDPNCTDTSSSPGNACARYRDSTPGNANTSTAGTLAIRRKFTNKSAANVTSLRFRIIDITGFTGGSAPPVGTADVRALNSQDFTATIVGGGTVSIKALTLETPPAQSLGGGLNSTLAAGAITLATPLSPANSINVEFLLGVQQTGSFRFFVIVEALFDAPVSVTAADPSKSGAEKAGGSKGSKQGSVKSGTSPVKMN